MPGLFDTLRSAFRGRAREPNISFKQSEALRFSLMVAGKQAIWTPASYEALAKEGFSQNVYAYACIRAITAAVSGIPWLLYKQGRTLTELEKHPLIDLLNRPNPGQGFGRFFENVVGYLLISGNSYIERVGPNGGPPRELYAIRPDRMKVIPGTAVTPIAGYEYSAGSNKYQYPPENILHLKLFNPTSDWYGMGPIEAASRSIDQNNESKAWNVALLQNYAQPSGVFRTEQNLDDEQFNRLQREINAKTSGASVAGRPLVLEAGLSWESVGMTPADMSWLEGQKLSAREIAIAFGVPPEIIGDNSAKTYSNYKEARAALYEETVLPLLDWLRDELNNWLTPLFGDGLYLDYDKDEIEALQESRDATWNRVKSSWWLTLDEARAATGYDEDPDFGHLYPWQLTPQKGGLPSLPSDPNPDDTGNGGGE